MNGTFRVAIAVLAIGCAACESGSPATARGGTPVKFVNCTMADKDCFVSARFDDRTECEQYRKLLEANCRFDDVGRCVECIDIGRPSTRVGYCV